MKFIIFLKNLISAQKFMFYIINKILFLNLNKIKLLL